MILRHAIELKAARHLPGNWVIEGRVSPVRRVTSRCGSAPLKLAAPLADAQSRIETDPSARRLSPTHVATSKKMDDLRAVASQNLLDKHRPLVRKTKVSFTLTHPI